MLDVAANEGLRRFDWRSLQKRQISPLPCNDIEGSMKAFDVVLAYRDNFDHFAFVMCIGHPSRNGLETTILDFMLRQWTDE